MLRAIDEFPSFFEPKGDSPLILDGGANIGVSVLEWKYRWPMCRVICFEPDPSAFALLKKNIDYNDVPGVQCIEAALADHEGRATLHGDFGRGRDGRGNSLRPDWGRRPASASLEVRCTRLSPYLLREPVAFLKLDVEGAEEAILRDAASALDMASAAYIEVHETIAMEPENSRIRIESLLRESGFQVETDIRCSAHALPSYLRPWQRRVGATQSQLFCRRPAERS